MDLTGSPWPAVRTTEYFHHRCHLSEDVINRLLPGFSGELCGILRVQNELAAEMKMWFWGPAPARYK